MKYAIVVFMSLFMTSACRPAAATVVNTQLTPEQMAKCEAEGGCLTLTRAALLKALEQAHAEGKATGASQRCWRPA